MLNLLIAIMGDTYANVSSIGEQTKFKELASMMSENEFVMNRSKVFGQSKYIVVCSLEKSAGQSNDVTSALESMKSTFSSQIND